MKNYSAIIYTLLFFSLCGNVNASQEEPKPKKEISISLNSSYYRNAKEVIEGFFKQANIRNKYIDSSLDKTDKKNFSFVDFTVDEAIEYLSSK